jgi:hypothetical protein
MSTEDDAAPQGADQIDEVQEDADLKASPQSIEDLAADLGWKPQDQYKGDPAKWRGAVEFIRAGQDIGNHLRKKTDALADKVERLVRTSAATTERMLREQEAELVAKFEQAVEDGDKTAAAKATRDLAAIDRQREASNPEADFARENPWYEKDDEATAYAVGISQRLAAQGKSVEDQLKAAAEGVRKRFPELFEDEKQKSRQAPNVNAPGTRQAAPQKREKSAADLPRDVRAAGEEFVKMAEAKGRKYTIEDYAKTYFTETGQAA